MVSQVEMTTVCYWLNKTTPNSNCGRSQPQSVGAAPKWTTDENQAQDLTPNLRTAGTFALSTFTWDFGRASFNISLSF